MMVLTNENLNMAGMMQVMFSEDDISKEGLHTYPKLQIVQ